VNNMPNQCFRIQFVVMIHNNSLEHDNSRFDGQITQVVIIISAFDDNYGCSPCPASTMQIIMNSKHNYFTLISMRVEVSFSLVKFALC